MFAQLRSLRLANPHVDDRVSDSIVEKRYFSVKSSSGSVIGIEHDRTGRVTRRDYGDGSYESYTWDALGRLHRINKRDISGNGYNWSADYDGLGRRLRVRHSPVVTDLSQSAQMNTVSSVYDPESEFLELGLKVDSNATQWEVYGNDLNGRYGGLHGIGGLLAIHGSDPATPVQPIDDVQGHQLGVINAGASAVFWHDRHYGAYGQLGATPRALELGGDVSQSFGWRGYRTDATGLIYMGARYYDAIAGRFISPDPLGHDASMDLYSYANGDPINFVDPTGRNAYGIDGTAFDVVRGLGDNRSNVRDFINRIDRSTGEEGVYFGGPGTRDYALFNQATGLDTNDVASLAYNRIKEDIANEVGNYQTINLVGWSRGAVAAVEVADRLAADGIEVNFLGLYDAVEMVPNPSEILPGDQAFSDTLPSNVQNFAHAQKTGPTLFAKDSLIPFPTSDYIPYWQDTNNSEQKFALTDPKFGFFYPWFRDTRSTHGDIGVNPTNTGAHQFILDRAVQAGVPLKNTDAAAQITDPVAGNNPPAPGKRGN